MINTRNIFVRLAMAAMAAVFAPAGALIIHGAFEVNQPHLFVMLIFSGSLTLLLGLTALVGLIVSFMSQEDSGGQSSDDQ